jgi:photosystem II stability/assembly factor-like uncharacterized protein
MMKPLRIFLLGVVTFLPVPFAESAAAPNKVPEEFRRLEFRLVGPAAGGRVCRAAGVPGDPLTYYAATASGGVWKSSDGGIHWKPVFDEQDVSTIGSLAIAPSDANVIYVGTGEANIRGNVEVGNGIYKSTDAGKTWKQVWKQEGQIGQLIVHPTNPDIAYAAVLGRAFAPNKERGVYRTVDGGKTWTRVLFKNAGSGASSVCFDANNPRILFAGLWQARRTPWSLTSGGPGSGLYTSRDGGDSWTQLLPPPKDDPEAKPAKGQKYCKGLPEGIYGKIAVAVAPSDSQRVYALIEAFEGGLFRSDDGGDTWTRINKKHYLRQRAWYFTTLTIDPKNRDVVYCPQVPLLKSIDGGKTFNRIKGTHHGDHHDLWIDPTNPGRMIDSNDGGLDISTTGGEKWFAPPLPICQFYHISVDNRIPYHIAGTMQDLGTGSGPSNSLLSGGIPLSAWIPVGGGEAGHTASDPVRPRIVYATEYGGIVTRFDARTRQEQIIGIYPYNPSGHGARDLKVRFQWTAPVLVSPHDHRVVYHAGNVLFRTNDGGKTWTAISPDLTRNDKSKQVWTGGPITGDNTGVEVYGTLFAVAESPVRKGLLWVGSDDGLVHVTGNGGETWKNVTPKGIPEWGTVTCIEPSPFAASKAFVTVEAHRLADRKPYLFRTNDGGKTWTNLSARVPGDLGYLRVIREDPKKQGLLFLGAERGLAYSSDEGQTWKRLKLNLPPVAVSDLHVKHNDLVVGTNGRSIWILDDLTPVREWSPALSKKTHLFEPPPAVLYHTSGTREIGTYLNPGKNPPSGAILHYTLARKPAGEITLEVVDAEGKQVRLLTSKKEPEEPQEEDGGYSAERPKKTVLPREAGLHRVIWDLRYQKPETIKGAKLDMGTPEVGPRVIPGTYTLKLTVDGETQTTTLRMLPDPRTLPVELLSRLRKEHGPGCSLGELLAEGEPLPDAGERRERLAFALRLREDISSLARTVNQIRQVAGQLRRRNELLAKDPQAKELIAQTKKVLEQMKHLEEQLHNPRAEVPYDILAQKGGAKLYSQLVWLFEQAKSSEGPVTQGLREVSQEQEKLLKQYQEEWSALRARELASLEAQARKAGFPGILIAK